MVDCIANGDCGSTCIHVWLQLYKFSVFFGFANLYISGISGFLEILKLKKNVNTRNTYIWKSKILEFFMFVKEMYLYMCI